MRAHSLQLPSVLGSVLLEVEISLSLLRGCFTSRRRTKVDQGDETRQGRATPDQYLLDNDRQTRAERLVGPGDNPADVACVNKGRGEGLTFITF